jgi:hypothetical protein
MDFRSMARSAIKVQIVLPSKQAAESDQERGNGGTALQETSIQVLLHDDMTMSENRDIGIANDSKYSI